jgi:NADPH-dependent F420 reductase
MVIGIIGGTGKQGTGLALRWARAGHSVAIGSRDAARARAHVEALAKDALGTAGTPGTPSLAIEGGDYAWAAARADVVVLTVPYEAHAETVRVVAGAIATANAANVANAPKVVIDVTVPLRPPKVARVHLPAGQAAALESQELLGPGVPVVAALHHVSSTHLADLARPLECDVLVAADDARAKKVALELMSDLGVRGLDAGALVNAIALESLTPVIIHMNRVYKSDGAGLIFNNLPAAPPLPPKASRGDEPGR